jgi:hypothetical protein
MYLLFPGRHQLLTNFQFTYIYRLIQAGVAYETDITGSPIGNTEKIEGIIFAVTSANHSHTRRNPLPFYLRVIQIEDFADDFPIPAYIFGIDEVGILPDFADYTLKRINHEAENLFKLTPANTLVICSSPVMKMYQQLGYRILPAEMLDMDRQLFKTEQPWDIVEKIAESTAWLHDSWILERMHPASVNIWKRYQLGDKVQVLFRDKIISDDGDITSTRDYNSYVRQMDEIALLKFHETEMYIRPGRIGDIGCAVGSWIKLACELPTLSESDFYGIEVARHLFELCQQRKQNGEFSNPFVFFAQKNAVTGLVFEKKSMHTINTSSLTHEIESYGSREDLLNFIRNRYEELTLGGIWINRDVVGPENGDEEILMELETVSGRNDDWDEEIADRQQLSEYLKGLSTYGRFLRFIKDFRRKEGEFVTFKQAENFLPKILVQISLKNAMEFALKKDYTDNWASEMHEKFCFWTFDDWKNEMKKAGFKILPQSKSYTNDWIVKNRLENKVSLYRKSEDNDLMKIDFPVTHFLLLAEK